ncbi:MAG TPA: flagellar biosynthesis anti-sigma factor FlgM [Acidobacteriaceae bacterium]
MSYTNGIGNTQNPFATETAATSGTAQTERTASVSLSNSAAPGTSPANAADHTKLSGFGGALAQVLSTSDVRMDKVTALQQAIAAGTYNVSASDVADKMIRSLLG